MADKPSPDRTDLVSKTREDLQTIAKVKGVDVSTRATKAALIEAIMGTDTPVSASRAVRSRRTVATPEDFESLLGEFDADASIPTPASAFRERPAAPARPASSPDARSSDGPAEPVANGDGGASRAHAPSRPERQPRDFSESGSRNRRNRRNRGRERPGGDAMPNADQPYAGELIEVEGLLDLRDDGYGFLRTRGYHPSPNDVYVSINMVRRYGLRKGDTVTGGFRPAASNEKYPALLRIDKVAGFDPEVAKMRPRFEDLTPLFPDEKLRLETN